jgi:hypothetical protein
VQHGKRKVSASFFEKKEAKKLLLQAGLGRAGFAAPRTKSFLLLFFKKEALNSSPYQQARS